MLRFRPYDWQFKDREEIDDSGSKILCIDIWCLDDKNELTFLRVQDFPVLCMLELPNYVNGSYTSWNEADTDLLMSEISYRFPTVRLSSYKLRMLKKIYYYRGGKKFPFLQCFFPNLKSMYDFKYKIDNQPITTKSFGSVLLRVWETDITPVTKMHTALGIRPCDWIYCKKEDAIHPEEKISIVDQEYIISYKDIYKLPDEEAKGLFTYPGILIYDGEMFSSKKGTFPNPLRARDATFLISFVYQKVGHPETRQRHAIVLGDCNDVPPEKMRNCIITRVSTEKEEYKAFCDIIKYYRPQILSGYNIDRFDVPYLSKRMGLFNLNWGNFSLIPSEPVSEHDIDWGSKQMGPNKSSQIKAAGFITFDLYPFCERSFKLQKYTLDTVANNVLGRGKHDVSPDYMFETYAMMQEALKTGNKDAIEEAKLRMDKVLLYCIEDSELVLDIFEKTNAWVSSVEFASVSGINIEDLYTRGQQISVYALIYNKAVHKGYVIVKVPSEEFTMSGGFCREPVKGLHDNAYDLDATSLYPTICISSRLDYTNFLPPEFNDSVDDKDFNIIEYDQEEKVKTVLPNGRNKKTTVIKHYKYKFYKHNKGIAPEVLEELLNARTRVKDEIKLFTTKLKATKIEEEKQKIEFMLVVLDKIQLAYKVRANSVFGFFGAKNGKLPLPAIAACITGLGRRYISVVDRFISEKHREMLVLFAKENPDAVVDLRDIEENVSQIIYNDTDSSFAKTYGIQPKDMPAFGRMVAREVSKEFPKPMSMAYEKSMYRMLCLKKKKYAYILYNDKGEPILDKAAVGMKGIVTARRDNCKFMRDTYFEILWQTLLRTPVYYVLKYLREQIEVLLSGQVKVEDLLITQKVGAVYAQANNKMKIFSDRMKALGRPVEPGERVDYLIVKVDEVKGIKTYLGEKMITHEMYTQGGDKYVLDYHYYLKNLMMSHIDQVISVAYGPELEHVEYKPPHNCKTIYLSTPVKLICKMLKYGLELSDIDPILDSFKPEKVKVSRRK